VSVPRYLQAWLGELVGTYAFVTIGAGAGIIAGGGVADLGLFGVAAANGLGLAVMVTVFAAISGGHFNPAITLSAWLGRRIRTVDAVGYVGFQILGALGAGLTLRVIFAESVWRQANLGAPGLGVGVSAGRGVLVEAVFTFFLALVVWGTGIDERGPRLGGFAIGLTVFVGVLAIGPLTGGAFNPARYVGPAAVANELSDWWVYFAGPAIGAGAVGLLYPTFFWGGWPWARIGGSPDVAPATESFEEPRKAGARKTTPRKPAARKR
jgi:MIP family channel proteins